MKTVGTVMATYNGERFLDEQLNSIINQTHRPQQIVIVDDRSQDGTKEIIEKYMNKFPRLFIFVENMKNMGLKKTFARGLSLCDTDYIALCDQDDIWKSEKIEKLFKALRENWGAKLCFHDLEIINQYGETRANSFWEKAPPDEPLPVVGRSARKRLTHFSNPVPGCTMFFDASLKEHILPMPSSDIGHDWWISAVAFFLADPIYIEGTLTKYRLHPYQAAGIGTTLKKKEDERKILPVHLRIAREIKRAISKKKLKREKLQSMNVSRYSNSIEIIQIIDKSFEMNLFQDRKVEYEMIRNKMKENLETYKI